MIHTLSLTRQYVRENKPTHEMIMSNAMEAAKSFFSPSYPQNSIGIQTYSVIGKDSSFVDVTITITYEPEKDVASVTKPEPIPGGKVYEVSATGLRPV